MTIADPNRCQIIQKAGTVLLSKSGHVLQTNAKCGPTADARGPRGHHNFKFSLTSQLLPRTNAARPFSVLPSSLTFRVDPLSPAPSLRTRNGEQRISTAMSPVLEPHRLIQSSLGDAPNA